MKERLEYIDALKGFAILLVVMGHVIPWSFQSFEDVKLISPSPVVLWKIIYSFHMPLFMFISGFLFGQSHFNSFKEYALKIWKKTKMLLVPYIACSILVFMWRGGREWTYWYLLTLLQLLIMVGGINFFIDKIKNPKYQIVAEIVALGGAGLLLQKIQNLYDCPALYVFFDWFPHLRDMFWYFVLGCFLMRHVDICKIMNKHIYSISLLFFCLSCCIKIPFTSFMGVSLQSLSAIYCCLYIFVECFTKGTVVDYFKRIGKKTLHIYILHLFFAVKITQLGDYFITLSSASRMEFVTAFVLQLLYSLIVSWVIIELSLYTGKLIKTSPLFAFILLGESVSVKKG